jgi:hypothetical protein
VALGKDESEVHRTLPLLFISHKHSDSAIADVIRDFITIYSAGGVPVFQSSSSDARSPRIAGSLSKELASACRSAGVLLLIFTDAEKDWANCMLEVGLAIKTDGDEVDNTKIILFQCGNDQPLIFSDKVSINLRSRLDVQKFVKEFLTSPDFFPLSKRPITMFSPNSRDVDVASENLFQKLAAVLPCEEEPTIEWPACPFLQLNLNLCDSIDFGGITETERVERIKKKCVIVNTDRYCEQLFEYPHFFHNMPFQTLVDRWKAKHGSTTWANSLSLQIADAAMWEFPRSIWDFMEGPNNKFYAPVLTRVRKMSAKGYMQFDVYFDRFERPAENVGSVVAVAFQHQKHS